MKLDKMTNAVEGVNPLHYGSKQFDGHYLDVDQSGNPDSNTGSLLVETKKIKTSGALGIGGSMCSQSAL